MSKTPIMVFSVTAAAMAITACAEEAPKLTPLKSPYDTVGLFLHKEGLTASPHEPRTDEEKGVFLFVLEEGVSAEEYAPMAAAAADGGWHVRIFNSGYQIDKLKQYAKPDTCVVIGGLGKIGEKVYDFGFRQREAGFDGGIVVATMLTTEEEYKSKFSTAVVVADGDGVVPPGPVLAQNKIYPSQSYFLTIKGGNHAGFYPGISFDGDGDATMSPTEQLDVLGKIANGRVDRFCQTRRKNIAEAERKAARENAQQ